MTDARIGYGSKYLIDGTEMGEVFEITPGGATTERIRATHMQSPGRRHEYIAGMIESGEATFQINWIPGSATDEAIRALLASGETKEHTIVFPNGITVAYDAQVTGFSKALPLDDRMTATITVSITGDETWGALAVPANLVPPSIVGTAVEVGVELTAITGAYSNAPDSFTYQWQEDDAGDGNFVDITGATGAKYTPAIGVATNFLRVGITPSNSAGAGSTVYSLPVGPVDAGA